VSEAGISRYLDSRRGLQSVRTILRLGAALLVVSLSWLVAAGAQDRTPTAKVGALWLTTPELAAPWLEALRQGFRSLGYVEGQNLTILARYAGGDSARFGALIDDLLDAQVDVLLAVPQAVPVAMMRTSTVPIVSASFRDPVAQGVVSSLARPGGNVTGLSLQSPELSAKRVALALEILPHIKRIAVLFDSTSNAAVDQAKSTERAAQHLGLRCRLFWARDPRSLQDAIAAILGYSPQLLMIIDSSLTVGNRRWLASTAIQAKIPLTAEDASFAEAGALFTYGASSLDAYRRAASYVDKLIKGAKAGELPIEQPTRFEYVLNATTADTLGIRVPQSVLLRADRVIR